jgi:galactokinase
MRPVEAAAAQAFRQRFGEAPEVVASAPGRVNLIGEHTDYSGGFVLPCAIDRRVAVALGRAGAGTASAELYSVDFQEARPATGQDRSWADYPRGVAWALADAGYPGPSFRAAIAGDLPIAAGLSSSAAIEAATALALDTVAGLGLARPKLALLCQRAENAFVGVNCGIMDQYASLLCKSGAALLVDCRSLEAEAVPLALDAAGLALLVCDTRVQRGLAGTAYNDRRASCEGAARTLGLSQLRDARQSDLARLEGEMLARARHVVTENQRVLDAAAALRRGDFATFGQLMYASHASLRDDFQVSIAELDTFVRLAQEAGALGARLTGAGFGGCAIALVDRAAAGPLTEATRTCFAGRGFAEPAFYLFHPSPGAEVVG